MVQGSTSGWRPPAYRRVAPLLGAALVAALDQGILMEGVPPHLSPQDIEAAMRTAHGVRAVHDLHVWTLTSGRDALSAHVAVEDLSDGQHVLGDLQVVLRQRFGIEHVTLQLESERSPLIQVTPRREANVGGSGATAPDASGHASRDADARPPRR